MPKHPFPAAGEAMPNARSPIPPIMPTLINAGGVFFLTVSVHDRIGIATTIERLIDMLDALGGDPDFEPYLANSWGDDREDENEHGGDILDEPHGDDEREFEPEQYGEGCLSWGNEGSQEARPC